MMAVDTIDGVPQDAWTTHEMMIILTDKIIISAEILVANLKRIEDMLSEPAAETVLMVGEA